jgi:hypothetical protein
MYSNFSYIIEIDLGGDIQYYIVNFKQIDINYIPSKAGSMIYACKAD